MGSAHVPENPERVYFTRKDRSRSLNCFSPFFWSCVNLVKSVVLQFIIGMTIFIYMMGLSCIIHEMYLKIEEGMMER